MLYYSRTQPRTTTSLQQYQAEVVINNNTGASYLSNSALARVCNRNESTIRSFVSSRGFEQKTAEVLTAAVLRSSRLNAEDAIAAAIVEYNPTLAKQLLQLGVRSLLHQLAGWKPQSQQKPLSQLDALVQAVDILKQHDGRIERLEAFAPVESYYTLTAYYNYHKRQWDVPSASAMGRKLKKASAELGFVVKPVHDARYSSVNSYHEEVLKHVLGF